MIDYLALSKYIYREISVNSVAVADNSSDCSQILSRYEGRGVAVAAQPRCLARSGELEVCTQVHTKCSLLC